MRNLYFFIFITFSINLYAQKNSSSLGFIENKGQIVDQKGRKNSSIKYLLNTNGLNVQLRENGFSYDVYETKKKIKKKTKEVNSFENPTKITLEPQFEIEYKFHRIDFTFLNSNNNSKLIAEKKSYDYDNYYNIVHAPQGITNVHKYQKVTYQNIYNQIDVVFFIPSDSTKVVEYNFIIKPGGKISDIKLKIEGGKTELVQNKIRMQLRFGLMEETIPMSWTEKGNNKNEIKINYIKIKKNVFGFEGALNSSDKTIVIDPVPIRLWGTYYGSGYQAFKTNTTKTDNSENVIFSGLTYSSNNVGTAGAFQSTGIPIWETGFIAKMNSSGNRIWGTYIKNNIYEARIYDLITNSSNEIYAAGYTWDQDGLTNTITTPGSFREFGGAFSREGILIKFDENGQRIWGTFYGGNGFDEIKTIDLDSNENLVIAGQTNSGNGISTSNSYLSSNPNSSFYSLGFFAKFNSNGNRIYGSYFQGIISFCNIDMNDNIYFAGQYFESSEYSNISTPSAHQTSCNNTDIFLVKFNSNFNREWCTYYGGNEYTNSFGNSDKVNGLGSDLLNNVYIIGTTSSSNNIATLGSFKENQIFGGIDAFVVKFNSFGVRQWGTYFGGNNTMFTESGESGFVSPEGNIYVAGNSRNYYELISTPNSFQPTPDGSDECFFSKFDTNGNLAWCSYYGTPSQDYSSNIYYKNNMVYLLGYSTAIATNGNDLGTPGTHMPNGGGFFLGKFQDCLSSPAASAINPCIGSNLNLNASGGTSYSWTGPNGFTSNLQNPTISNVNATHSGQYICTITGTGGCDGPNTINVVVGDTVKPIPNVASLPTISGDCNTIVATIPTATDNCAGTITGTTTDPLTYSLPGTYTINWNYNDGNGNIETQTQNIIISSVSLPTATSPQTFCIQQNATVNDILISGTNINWYDSSTAGNLLPNSTILINGTTYYAAQTINGCESLRVPVTISIQNTPIPTGNASQEFCAISNPTLSEISVSGTAINWYANNASTTILPNSTALVDGTTYFATQTINGCESVGRLMINVSLINTLNANDYSQSFCDDLNDGSENIVLSDYNSNLIASTTGMNFTYYSSYYDAENEIITNQLNTNYTLSIGSTVVYVRLDSANGCHQIVELNLSLFQKPVILINDVMPICKTSNIVVNAGSGFNSYSWSTGASSQSIVISAAGTYSVNVTKNYGSLICSSTKTFTVVASEIANITSIDTQDWTDTENVIIVSTAINDNYLYSLDGINYQVSNIFSNLPSGFYTVYVKDECGIIDEDVVLLNYPKFFTPNDDGTNDYWRIKFSQYEPNLTVTIFDRYGKIMKVLNPNSVGWDGTYNGTKMISDDYWFVVKREDGREHRAHFTLKR